MHHPRRITSIVVATLIALATAHAADTPDQRCHAEKTLAAGKYTACRQAAEAKLATSGDTMKYNDTLTRCSAKFTSAWEKADDKAFAAATTCLDAPLTALEFDSVIAEHTDNITTALTGGGLDDCQSSCGSGGPPGRPLATGQTACWDSAGQTIACGGTGQDGELQKGLPRAYVDNGNGTITDTQSGLMWEKLSDDGSVHDRDNLYTWDDVFAGKLAVLNGSGGFAGHADWRVPNVTELQSLLDYGAVSPAVDVAFNSGCAPGCSVTMCSCTGLGSYWSSSTYQPQRSWAWIGYSTGVVGGEPKTFDHAVRAVRGR